MKWIISFYGMAKSCAHGTKLQVARSSISDSETSAWQFYEIQRHDISKIRTTFLLRILVVDSQPLQAVLNEWCLPSVSWEIRYVVPTVSSPWI